MGNGSFSGGKFNLTVGFINHTPTTAALAKWHKSFELASKILHAATLGQSQFGKIRLRMNSTETGSHDDIFIWNLDADDETTRAKTSPPTHSPYTLPNNAYTRIFNVHQKYSFVITHEFGHLAFNLRDEYVGPYGHTVPSCRKTVTPYYACIMEFSRHEGAYIDSSGSEVTAGKVDQFCSYEITGHDTTSGTAQQAAHPGKSCWDVINSLYSDIDKPDADNMPEPNPYVPIEWNATSSLRKHVFTMVGAPNIQGSATGQAIKNNATFTAHYLLGSGHHFGVVSANPDAQAITPLAPVTQKNIEEITSKINSVDFQPSTQIVPAIALAANMHSEGPSDADHQSIIVSAPGTTGLGNATDLLDKLSDNYTYLHSTVVSEGPLSDELDQNVVNRWSSHHVFDDKHDDEDQAIGLQSQHIQHMFETDGRQLIGYKSGRLPATIYPARKDGPEQKPDRNELPPQINLEMRSDGFDYTILVEEGAEKIDFLASVLDNKSVDLSIIQPNGEEPGLDARISDQHKNSNHYHWFSIEPPIMPGRWIMRLRRKRSGEPITFRLLAYSKHPELNARLFASPSGKRKVKLIADVSSRGKLFGVEPPVVEIFSTRHHGTQLNDLVMRVVLEPVVSWPVASVSDNSTEDSPKIETAEGTYQKEIELKNTGSYTAVLRISNAGTAVRADNDGGLLNRDLGNLGFGNTIPNFVRFIQIPIRVTE